MNCRNVSLILAAGAVLLLGGCETYYSLRRDIGMDPELAPQPQPRPQRMATAPRAAPAAAPAPAVMTVPRADAPAASMQTAPMQTPPMQATAMPAPIAPAPPAAAGNGIAQASWAAQRAASLSQQNQTLPFGAPEPKIEPKPEPAVEPTPEPKAGPAAAASKPSDSASAAKAGDKPAAVPAKSMPAAVAASAAGSGLWRAHLASHRTEQAAINEWQERLKADPKRYDGLDPLVIWTDVPSRGAFARLTVGAWAEKKRPMRSAPACAHRAATAGRCGNRAGRGTGRANTIQPSCPGLTRP